MAVVSLWWVASPVFGILLPARGGMWSCRLWLQRWRKHIDLLILTVCELRSKDLSKEKKKEKISSLSNLSNRIYSSSCKNPMVDVGLFELLKPSSPRGCDRAPRGFSTYATWCPHLSSQKHIPLCFKRKRDAQREVFTHVPHRLWQCRAGGVGCRGAQVGLEGEVVSLCHLPLPSLPL